MGANDNSALTGDSADNLKFAAGVRSRQTEPENGGRARTILVAAIPAAAEVIVDALSDVANLTLAHSLPMALHRIAYGVDLVVAGTYFDGARMFDLLRAVKDDPATNDIPVICVRAIAAPTTPEAAVRQPIFTNQAVVDSACRALGAVAFLDLCERPPLRSSGAAKAALARLARTCLEGGDANLRPA
jgi:CheY-like chemotaxis protein